MDSKISLILCGVFILCFLGYTEGSCSSGQIKCKSSSQCVNLRDICRNGQQCLDGSDEDTRICSFWKHDDRCYSGQFHCPLYGCRSNDFCTLCSGQFDAKFCEVVNSGILQVTSEDTAMVLDMDSPPNCTGLWCNTGECVPRDSVCDITRDCQGGEDELFCETLPLGARCDFEKGWCGWQNRIDDQMDFRRNRGSTEKEYTGPQYDHTFGNESGWYFLSELPRQGRLGDHGVLESPYFDPPPCYHGYSQSPFFDTCKLRFFYHKLGRYQGMMSVTAVEKDPSSPDSTKTHHFELIYGNKGPAWQSYVQPIPHDIRYSYKILISNVRGTRFSGDLGIDDFSLSPECFGKGVGPEEEVKKCPVILLTTTKDPVTTTPPTTVTPPYAGKNEELVRRIQAVNVTSMWSCPRFYTRIGETCLSFFSPTKIPWPEARQFCLSRGGDLLYTGEKILQEEILQYMRMSKLTSSYWIGGRYSIDTNSWSWVHDDSPMPLGSPYWTIRYSSSCVPRSPPHTDPFSSPSAALPGAPCYNYVQAPKQRTAGWCAAMTYEHFYYFSDEVCQDDKTPLCVYTGTFDEKEKDSSN